MLIAVGGITAPVLAAGLFRAVVKSRRWHLFGRALHRVTTSRPVVALTLDDGPYPGHCQEILDILREKQVHATFFLVGRDVDAHPELAVAIRGDGHELANHSYSHRRMLLLGARTVGTEIGRTDDALRRAGQTGSILFRPPNCAKLYALPRHLHRTGRPMITWDVEPETRPGPAAGADEIVERTLRAARPGSIILLHPMGQANAATRKALPAIVDGLLEKGFDLVTVSELIEAGRTGRPARRVHRSSRSA